FFAVRLDAVDLNRLRPSGFKIFLEILARGGTAGVVGVPYEFQPRHDGQSKASMREGFIYLRRLISLRLGVGGPRLAQLVKFLLVGGSGVAVNTAALWLLSSVWSVPYLLGSVLATQVAILWNFILLERLVFHDSGRGFFAGLARFWVLNLVLLPVQLGLLAVAVEALDMPTVPANVVVLGVVFVLRYLFTAGWVFRWRADPLEVVAAPTPPRRRWPTPSAAWFAARLCGPAVVTLIAFPALVTNAVAVFGRNDPMAAITLSAVVVAAITLVVTRAAPAPDEPPVHDRQVDSILAIVFGVPAVWLTFGVDPLFRFDTPLDARMIFAANGFLVAACLILLGTRLTARIRLALVAPMLSLLPVAGLSVPGEVMAWAYVVVAALVFARWLRGTGRDRATDLAMHQQFLPAVVPGLPILVATGAVFGASALLAQTGVLT
ncbi:MAG TPA: GtrA family protein, partial [Microlunatus sp.]|nr:GtrA family protein [Microlunatus sp.]